MPVQAELLSTQTIEEMTLFVRTEFNPASDGRLSRRALRQGMNIVRDEIARTTPVDTGELRDSTYARISSTRRIALAEAGWRDLLPKMLVLEFGGFANVGLPNSSGNFRPGRFIITDAWNRTFPAAVERYSGVVIEGLRRASAQTATNARRAERRLINNLRNRDRRIAARNTGASGSN